MIKLVPIILLLAYGWAYYLFSAKKTAQALTKNSTPLKDPILAVLTARMAEALELPQIVVYIYEVAPINGLASPDGRVFLTRGFIEKYKSGFVTADELASVIAHEIGHIALGHVRRRGIDFVAQNLLRMALSVTLRRFVPFIGSYLVAAICMMMAAKLSRKDEFEADAYASAVLIKSGIGTQAQKSLLAKLEKLTDASGRALTPAWFSSHPKANERIAAIEAREKKWNHEA